MELELRLTRLKLFLLTMASSVKLAWIALFVHIGLSLPMQNEPIQQQLSASSTQDRIHFNELISNIQILAIESAIRNLAISKYYEYVTGPSATYIGTLMVDFNPMTETVIIYCYYNGIRYLHLNLHCQTQVGNIVAINAVSHQMTDSIILTLADLISRTIVAPAELPIGIITGALGTPFFFFILFKQKNAFSH